MICSQKFVSFLDLGRVGIGLAEWSYEAITNSFTIIWRLTEKPICMSEFDLNITKTSYVVRTDQSSNGVGPCLFYDLLEPELRDNKSLSESSLLHQLHLK